MTVVLLVPAHERFLPAEMDLPDDAGGYLRGLQALVGGYVQLAPLPGRPAVALLVNEDGFARGLSPNPRATRLWASLGELEPFDVGAGLVGDAVLSAVDLVTGAHAPIPTEVLALARQLLAVPA